LGRAVLLLSLAGFAGSASLRATDPLLRLIAEEFQVTTGAASGTVTAFALAYGVCQIIYGPLGDRYGRYRTIAVAALVSAFGTGACAIAPSLNALLLARLLSGAVVGAFIPLSLAWIGDTFAYERRQAVFAQFLIGQMLGIGLGTAIAGWLAENFGWRSVFVALSVVLLIVAALLALELRRNAVTGRIAASSIAQSVRRMPTLFASSRVRLLLAIGFAEGALIFGAFAFVAYSIQQRFDVGPAAAGTLLSAFAAGGLLYAFSAKGAIRRFGEIGLATAGGTACVTGYAILAVAASPLFAALGIATLGAGFYALHTTVQTKVTQGTPEERGSTVALFASFLFLGQGSGVWLAARVVDAWATPPLFAVSAAGLLGLSLVFRALLLRWRNVA
jgi:MFS transporter, YNFM family, putative membrane transport protein